ncbi:tetraspanin-18-like [Haliotis rubra]|uniref:tetraspanin-18-like n=1 Tax=Haliotis rubra TaxID=36100 RepID=UPI001EE5E26D|nr:tetraspanin-18-like [Haliotis rubra]
MGTCTSIGKCMLILLNVIFVIISMGLLAVGVILKFFPGLLMSFLMAGISSVSGFSKPGSANNLTSIPLIDDLGLALIVFGAVLFLISFFACCGACCMCRPFLILFVVFMMVVIISLATLGGLFLAKTSTLHSSIRGSLKTKVRNEYKGPENDDIFSLIINVISYGFKCCAISGPDDFDPKASWRTYTYNGATVTVDVSPACCKPEVLKTDTTLECAKKDGFGVYDSMKTNTQGCYDKILEEVEKNKLYAILGLVGLLLLLLLEVIFAIVLIKDISDKAKVGPV